MNYLSHYYFDQHSNDPELILGGLLPDLVHSFEKKGTLKPTKHLTELGQDPPMASLLRGWERHKAIDKYFHGAEFFVRETEYLKVQLREVFTNPGPYIFFMAHILLELCLDSLLVRTRRVDPQKVYDELGKIAPDTLERFFTIAESTNPAGFYLYLQNFIRQGFLLSYGEPAGIIYATDRICERLWKTRFTDDEKERLSALITAYQQLLEPRFTNIYQEINALDLP